MPATTIWTYYIITLDNIVCSMYAYILLYSESFQRLPGAPSWNCNIIFLQNNNGAMAVNHRFFRRFIVAQKTVEIRFRPI